MTDELLQSLVPLLELTGMVEEFLAQNFNIFSQYHVIRMLSRKKFFFNPVYFPIIIVINLTGNGKFAEIELAHYLNGIFHGITIFFLFSNLSSTTNY